MNIHTTIEKMEEMIKSVGNKINFTTFVIGHPYETEKDMDLTIDFIKRNNLWYTNGSPYQDAPGLISHTMPRLSTEKYRYLIEKFYTSVNEFRKEKMNELINSRVNATISYCICYTDVIELWMNANDLPCEIVVTLDNNDENQNKLEQLNYFIKCKVTINGIKDYKYRVFNGVDMEVCHEDRCKMLQARN